MNARILARLSVAAVMIVWITACDQPPNQEAKTRSDLMNPSDELRTRLQRMTIAEVQAAYRAGTLTISEVTQHYLGEIETRNDELRAVIAVNPDALLLARQQDQAIAKGEALPFLFGVPVLIKDNIETRELPTTAGSLALAKNRTGRDAPLVEHLRASGAIILGKANLSEWANFRSERSSSGWSGVGGQTRNPHDPARSPCGSSSGSGAAVAGGMAMAAIGTETNGSIVCPASVNGVVGVKPTVGLVSQQYIVPISHTQDTAGPMTRSVADAALLLKGMQEGDADYVAGLDKARLKTARIGVVRSFAGFHEGVDAVFNEAIETLKAGGVTIVDGLKVEAYNFRKDSYSVLLYEFKTDLNKYLEALPGDESNLTLEKLIAFNESHRDQEMPWFEQEIFLKSQALGSLDSEDYLGALSRVGVATREAIDKALLDNQLDAIVAPTGGAAWTIDQVNGDHGRGGAITGYAAIAGYPHVTVPMGTLHGLPLGLSFVSAANHDADLLSIAYSFEAQLNFQKGGH